MIMFLPMPTGSGYNGPKQDTSRLGLPMLPEGWHFQVTDTGDGDHWIDRFLGFGVCSVWLLGPGQSISMLHQIGCGRSVKNLRRAAYKIVKRATKNSEIYGGVWDAFKR